MPYLRVTIATVAATAAASLVNPLIRNAAVLVLDAGDFEPFEITAVVTSSAGATAAGGLFFAVLGRFTRRPIRPFIAISSGFLLVSFAPPVGLLFTGEYPGTSIATVAVLCLMHVTCAGILIPAMVIAMRGTANPTAGKLLIAVVAVVAAVTPYLADWNETHVYNPAWPPHAKFHTAHTLLLGTLLGVLSLAYLRLENRAGTAALIAAVYWIAQGGSILVPGTAFVDPEFAGRVPLLPGGQVTLASVFVLLAGLGYLLEARRSKPNDLMNARRGPADPLGRPGAGMNPPYSRQIHAYRRAPRGRRPHSQLIHSISAIDKAPWPHVYPVRGDREGRFHCSCGVDHRSARPERGRIPPAPDDSPEGIKDSGPYIGARRLDRRGQERITNRGNRLFSGSRDRDNSDKRR